MIPFLFIAMDLPLATNAVLSRWSSASIANYHTAVVIPYFLPGVASSIIMTQNNTKTELNLLWLVSVWIYSTSFHFNILFFFFGGLTEIPRHPLPFAAKNMFYDERWIEKQERGFTWWMNYVLTPDDFKVATEVTKGVVFCRLWCPHHRVYTLLLTHVRCTMHSFWWP